MQRRNRFVGGSPKVAFARNRLVGLRMRLAAMVFGGLRFRRTIVFGAITVLFILIIFFKIFDGDGAVDLSSDKYGGASYGSKYIKHPKLTVPRRGLNSWGQVFTLNNEPFRILSGSMHYFRVVPEYWRDRLRKMRACGLNTVMTYVPWNAHEESRGKWNFDGILNLELFLQIAQQEDLYVILRPGPYICAEWEFGGLPAWLLEDPEMRIRSVYAPFLKAVDDYFDVVIALVERWQYQKGGPIIAVQVENEYGSYGYDLKYLTYIKEGLENRGISEMLMTSDGAAHLHLGSIPSVFASVNFVNGALQSLEALKLFQPDRPLMVAEFWSGWFDHWGEAHHRQNTEDFKKALTVILETGASVNFYMFHGGTNFGFMNGANTRSDDLNEYQPTVSSYDYDAPISENGLLTEKYFDIKSLLVQYASDHIPVHLPTPLDIPSTRAVAYGYVMITEYAAFTDTLSLIKDVQKVREPVPMELLPGGAQSYGYIVYRKKLPYFPSHLKFAAIVMDTAWVFVNGMMCGSVSWVDRVNLTCQPARTQSYLVEILVENQGRVNYGVRVGAQWKGIVGPITAGQDGIKDWTVFPVTMKEKFINGLWGNGKWKKLSVLHTKTPGFYHSLLHISQAPHDTFINMHGWGKGVVFVNGRNIGRYWNIGPQYTLFIPAPLLKLGQNQIIVFELEKSYTSVTFQDQPTLGPPLFMSIHTDVNRTTDLGNVLLHLNANLQAHQNKL